MVHHGAGLRKLIGDGTLVEQLQQDWRQADISAADRAMLEYAVKLTLEPWNMEFGDVAALREAGFQDAAGCVLIRLNPSVRRARGRLDSSARAE